MTREEKVELLKKRALEDIDNTKGRLRIEFDHYLNTLPLNRSEVDFNFAVFRYHALNLLEKYITEHNAFMQADISGRFYFSERNIDYLLSEDAGNFAVRYLNHINNDFSEEIKAVPFPTDNGLEHSDFILCVEIAAFEMENENERGE